MNILTALGYDTDLNPSEPTQNTKSPFVFPGAKISVVGGGGKTSFIFTLAKEAAQQGLSVLVTTTTAMFNPRLFNPRLFTAPLPDQAPEIPQPFDQLVTGELETLAQTCPEPGKIIVGAQALTAGGKKLAGFDGQDLDQFMARCSFDLVLIEADGARMRPVKAPAAHEPVIPSTTTLVAGCIGLDCLGAPLTDTRVHRPEILAARCNQAPGSPITIDTLTSLIAHPQGLFKSRPASAGALVILNKADSDKLARQAKQISAAALSSHTITAALVTQLSNPRNPVISVME